MADNLTSVTTGEDTLEEVGGPQRYVLQRPIEYSQGGEGMRSATFIELLEPAGKNRGQVFALEEFLVKAVQDSFRALSAEQKAEALKEREKVVAEGNDVTLSGENVISLLMDSDRVSFGEVVECVRTLLCNTGLAMVDGSTKLTRELADELSIGDLKGLVGAFIAGFIVESSSAKKA